MPDPLTPLGRESVSLMPLDMTLARFDNLFLLSDEALRELLTRISAKELTLALVTAAKEVTETFVRNMESLAARMINEDLNRLECTGLDVYNAQCAIVVEARRLVLEWDPTIEESREVDHEDIDDDFDLDFGGSAKLP